jgi:hypothetical protein
MPAINIVDDHHFVKHCKNKLLIRENGVVIGVQPDAFHLRQPDDKNDQERWLSGVYYEFFEGDDASRIQSCRGAILLTMKPKDALVQMRAGSIREAGKQRSRSLRVTHERSDECPSYAALHGLPIQADHELCGLLSKEPVVRIVEISKIPA